MKKACRCNADGFVKTEDAYFTTDLKILKVEDDEESYAELVKYLREKLVWAVEAAIILFWLQHPIPSLFWNQKKSSVSLSSSSSTFRIFKSVVKYASSVFTKPSALQATSFFHNPIEKCLWRPLLLNYLK